MIELAEDGVAAVAHAGGVQQLVGQADVLQRADRAQHLAHVLAADGQVELAGAIAHAHGEPGQVAAGLGLAGLIREQGRYVVVSGAVRVPLDELVEHGSVCRADAGELIYVAKYLAVALESHCQRVRRL